MTFAYGSKTFGMSRQLQESLVDSPDPDLAEHTRYLAGHIWQALEAVVHAAFGALEWLADCADKIVPVTGTVDWVVPMTNFPVRQEYWNMKRSMVKTTLCGQALRLSIYRATKEAIKQKHKNSIAPNFIHSLDAAALMVTVVMASTEGVEAFGMVHDSYATHACDVPALAVATREAFIAIYDGVDVADNLHQQFSLVAEVPSPPTKGTFDVHEVRDSRYFFS